MVTLSVKYCLLVTLSAKQEI